MKHHYLLLHLCRFRFYFSILSLTQQLVSIYRQDYIAFVAFIFYIATHTANLYMYYTIIHRIAQRNENKVDKNTEKEVSDSLFRSSAFCSLSQESTSIIQSFVVLDDN